MKCPFYNCDSREDNPHFDDPAAHLIITVGPLGHTHIHGPFEDAFMVKKMADALIQEIRGNGIEYTPPKISGKGGDILDSEKSQ